MLLQAPATSATTDNIASLAGSFVCLRSICDFLSSIGALGRSSGRPLSVARGRYMAPPLDTHGQSSRSSKLTSPNSAIAISVSSRMQAKMRAVCRFGVDAWIR